MNEEYRSRKLALAICNKRTDFIYKNVSVTWSILIKSLASPRYTSETMEEYLAMSKDEQGDIKDVGGFVGGYLKDGKRGNNTVERRSLITLDIDDGATMEILEKVATSGYELIIYGTHKFRLAKPRCRIVMPLSRDVSSEEYEFIARIVASELCDINAYDPTTFSVSRMMYWQSTPRDITYYFRRCEGKWVDPDLILANHPNWKDVSSWPRAEGEKISKGNGKLIDPRTKGEPIGAFCECYSPKEAIEEFLSDYYQEGQGGRYTYLKGSSSNGLRIYKETLTVKCEDATDPANTGTSINAFDLVRIHLFGELDEGVSADMPINKLPSYQKMCEWAKSLPLVQEELSRRALEELGLGGLEKETNQEEIKLKKENQAKPKESKKTVVDQGDWKAVLTFEKRRGGESIVSPTSNNILLIMHNDPNIVGMAGTDLFKDLPMVLRDDLPWRRKGGHKEWTDTDDAGLRVYLERTYKLEARQKIIDCFSVTVNEHAYHPVKSFIESRKWDGIERVETLFIDYLGAEDSEYTRVVTRKLLVAAITRIYEPGAKFDYMPILVGSQGIGKSLLIKKIGYKWTQDAIPDIRTSKAYEALDGAWIVEMGELATLNKADRESIKLYLTKTEDTYRKAYARNVTISKRTCVFIGTTNEMDFLNDSTGNRRFLPIVCNGNAKVKPWDLEEEEVRQLWAEAKEIYDEGEQIMDFPESVTKVAEEQQEAMSYLDTWQPQIEAWLEEEMPAFYFDMNIEERAKYAKATAEFKKEMAVGKLESEKRLIRRDKTCVAEVCCEWLGIPKEKVDRQTSYRVSEILKSIKSWHYTAKTRRFGPYGRQKAFIRKGERKNG